MSKKFIPVFSIILLLVSLIAPGIQPVAAEETEEKIFEDGEYEVPLKVLHADKDEESSMQNFVKESKSLVNVTDGKAEVMVTLTSADMIKGFEVDNKKAKIIDDNENKNELTYSFIVNDLDEIVQGKIAVEVPGMYDTTHDVRLQFDTSNVPEVEEDTEADDESEDDQDTEGSDESEGGQDTEGSDESEGDQDTDDNDKPEESDKNESDDKEEDEGEETEEEKPEENGISLDNLKDGYYTIDAHYLKSDEDDTSSMGNYLSDEVFIAVKDGNPELTVTIEEDETVTKLEVAGKTANEKEIDGKKRYETFNLKELEETLNAYVEYQAPFQGSVFEGNAEFRIDFDEDSIEKAKATDKPEAEKLSLNNLKDGYYTIGVEYLKSDDDDTSSMGNYLSDTIFVAVKDGKAELTVTVEEDETVTNLELAGKAAHEKEVDGEKRYETFNVKKLESTLTAYVEYQAAFQGGVFEGDADFRVAFDEDSIEKAKASDKPKGEIIDDSQPETPEEPTDSEEEKKTGDEFKLGYTFFEKGKNKESTMNNFKKGSAKIKEDKHGNYLVSMEFNSGNMIEYLEIDNKRAKVIDEYKDKNGIVKVFEFKVKNLKKKHAGKVKVNVPGMYNTAHEVDLVFDKVGTPPTPPSNPKQTVESKGDNGEEDESKKEKATAYNYQKMKYTFYKSGTMEKSIMDDFSEEFAIVRTHKKNGKQYATLTFANPEMIKYIKVNGVDAQVIKQTKEELVVDFPVNNLNKKQSVKAFIEVPGMYATEHAVDLVFDTGSATSLALDDIPDYLKEYIETSGSRVSPIDDEGGQGGPTANSGPDFDRDADGNIISSNNDNNSGVNPKTADLNMQQVMLFASLLLLSFIPIAIKVRRKFVTAK